MHEFLIASKRIQREPLPDNDPYIDKVTLLMHMEGAHGSTTFVDSTGLNTLTAFAPAIISTAQSRFGASSAFFDGVGGYVNGPNRPGYSFGTDDFTIEAWVYLSLAGQDAANTIITGLGANPDGSGGAQWTLFVLNTGRIVFDNSTEGGPNVFYLQSDVNVVKANKQTHISLSRIAGVFYFHADGILLPFTYNSSDASKTVSTIGPIRIGRLYSGSQWNHRANGYIDEVRITKGVGRYKNNFVVPTKRFMDPA